MPDPATVEAPPPAGHNLPPQTPFDKAAECIDLLHFEAANWLDGDAIETQGQADTVAKLLRDMQTAWKAADGVRKVEAAPFDEGKAEVQARYKPLLGRAKGVTDLCKRLTVPWLVKVNIDIAAKAETARREADEAAAKAAEAHGKAAPTDLAAIEEAERFLDDAKAAEAHAKHAARDKAQAKGGGKAVTLRSVWSGAITNLTVCARHYWETDRAALEELIAEMVRRDVRAGARDIPGVEITEELKAQ